MAAALVLSTGCNQGFRMSFIIVTKCMATVSEQAVF